MGLVKNRCKNGDHYWVDAFASPIKENGKTVEYQSVRLAPKREHVKNAEKIYAQLNQGNTPLQLKLPRTRLWQRMASVMLLIAIAASAIASFSPTTAIWVFFALKYRHCLRTNKTLRRTFGPSAESFRQPFNGVGIQQTGRRYFRDSTCI